MKLPRDASRLWQFGSLCITALRPLACGLRVEGTENVPARGGAVIACNHPGGADVFFLGYACPRQIFYMAKRELFDVHPLLTFLLHRIGAYPINRGTRDKTAIDYSVQLLRQGRLVGMFPEGTRNRGRALGRGRSGAVRIALEAGVPVVPAIILGVPDFHRNWYNPLKRAKIYVRFGPPLVFPAGELAQEYTAQVMFAIARMLPPELRGPYAEPGQTAAPGTAAADATGDATGHSSAA